jgi:hypothetical protein
MLMSKPVLVFKETLFEVSSNVNIVLLEGRAKTAEVEVSEVLVRILVKISFESSCGLTLILIVVSDSNKEAIVNEVILTFPVS